MGWIRIRMLGVGERSKRSGREIEDSEMRINLLSSSHQS